MKIKLNIFMLSQLQNYKTLFRHGQILNGFTMLKGHFQQTLKTQRELQVLCVCVCECVFVCIADQINYVGT